MLYKKFAFIFFAGFSLLLGGCYSFTGASISPEAKTVSIKTFKNTASTIYPGLSSNLSEALRNKFQSQTTLHLIEDNGDLKFTGSITGYTVQPTAIESNDKAAMNRLRITVSVVFINTKETNFSYEQSFSSYRDYEASRNLSSVEAGLVKEITDELVEQIFNKAVANW